MWFCVFRLLRDNKNRAFRIEIDSNFERKTLALDFDSYFESKIHGTFFYILYMTHINNFD